MILCLTFRHLVTPSISHWHCSAISTFCLPGYKGLMSFSELPSPSPFHPLSPLCLTVLGKKSLLTHVQHCSSHWPKPWSFSICDFSSVKTRCPLHLAQCFRSFQLTGPIAGQILRDSQWLPSSEHTCLHTQPHCSPHLVTIPPTRVYFALSHSSSTWNLINGIRNNYSPGLPSKLFFSIDPPHQCSPLPPSFSFSGLCRMVCRHRNPARVAAAWVGKGGGAKYSIAWNRPVIPFFWPIS